MALPTGPIPRVAFEEYIEEAWGDSVAQSLNNVAQSFDYLIWQPTSTILAPTSYSSTGDLALWFRVGGSTAEITVPDWAHHVVARVDINGLYVDGAGEASYCLQLQIGPNTGRRINSTATQTGTPTTDDWDWFGVSWTDRIACSSIEGDRAVRILAGQYASTQRWVAHNYSDVGVFLTFIGPSGQTGPGVGFYPEL